MRSDLNDLRDGLDLFIFAKAELNFKKFKQLFFISGKRSPLITFINTRISHVGFAWRGLVFQRLHFEF